MSKKRARLWKNPEYRARMSKRRRDKWKDPEFREKMLKAIRKSAGSEKRREKAGDSVRRRWKDPEQRKLFVEGAKSQWTPKKRKNRTKELERMWGSGVYDEHGDKIRKLWKDPEFRKRQLESRKARWQDPEHREKMSRIRSKTAKDSGYVEKQKRANKAKWESPDFVKSQGLLLFSEMKRKIEKAASNLRVSKTDRPTRLCFECSECGTKWKEHWCYHEKHLGRCPGCEPHFFKGIEEAKVRRIFERVTGWKFKKMRPKWLKGRGKVPLELDGYNEEHKVAFEYQGFQHYRPMFGDRSLVRTKKNDERKRLMCLRKGVALIRVPYFKKDLEGFIERKLSEAGVV